MTTETQAVEKEQSRIEVVTASGVNVTDRFKEELLKIEGRIGYYQFLIPLGIITPSGEGVKVNGLLLTKFRNFNNYSVHGFNFVNDFWPYSNAIQGRIKSMLEVVNKTDISRLPISSGSKHEFLFSSQTPDTWMRGSDTLTRLEIATFSGGECPLVAITGFDNWRGEYSKDKVEGLKHHVTAAEEFINFFRDYFLPSADCLVQPSHSRSLPEIYQQPSSNVANGYLVPVSSGNIRFPFEKEMGSIPTIYEHRKLLFGASNYFARLICHKIMKDLVPINKLEGYCNP